MDLVFIKIRFQSNRLMASNKPVIQIRYLVFFTTVTTFKSHGFHGYSSLTPL